MIEDTLNNERAHLIAELKDYLIMGPHNLIFEKNLWYI